MSNPWKESAADVAITPLTFLLASFQDTTADSKDSPGDHGSDSLVQKLRLVDEITEKRRDLKYKNKIESMYSETTLTNGLVEELDSIFGDLCNVFQSFQCGNLLKTSYENAVYLSASVKDNINDDNRAKIVELIRACVKVIRKLKDTKSSKSQHRDDRFLALLRSSSIMSEGKGVEDFSADDLCELVSECAAQIKIITSGDLFASVAAETPKS